MRSSLITTIQERHGSDIAPEDATCIRQLDRVKTIIEDVSNLHPDAMWFGYKRPPGAACEPFPLQGLDSWNKVGHFLCALGSLVGADVPRLPDDQKTVPPITALQYAASNEGRAIKVMLISLEEQKATIRRQEQAITALQFRHLLEMVPSGGVPPKPGKATADWQTFWNAAVAKAYHQHRNPPPPGEDPSPLLNLLKPQFRLIDADTSKTNNDKLKWLKNSMKIGQRGSSIIWHSQPDHTRLPFRRI